MFCHVFTPGNMMMCYDLMCLWKLSRDQLSLAHSTKVKHRHARENKKKQLKSVQSVPCVERYKNYGVKERRSDGWWRGDEGNDELMWVRSNESDRSSWSAGWRSSLGRWFHRLGDVWRKERLLTFKEEEEGERQRIDSVMRPRSSSRGRNTSASVTVTVTLSE